jgi:hypothetical protein
LTHFDELKTFKSIEKQTLFLIFVIFGKVEKKPTVLELILNPFWKSAAPKLSLFARLLSQGYLQIHLPKEITKEKVM